MYLKSFIRMLLAIGLLAPAMVLAQEAPAENSESNNAQAMQHEHGEGNCFKQAGISQSTMEQIKDLHQKMDQHEGRMAGKGHGMHGDPCAHILAHKDKDKDHDQK